MPSSKPSHPGAMAPKTPGPTRTAAPMNPGSWPTSKSMKSYARFGMTGWIYLLASIVAIEIELDRDKRRVLWKRVQQIYAEKLPAIPLYFRADGFILPKWLRGVRPTGHMYTTTHWIEEWRVE